MDTMPSSEFRKRYATLTRQTVVTVNGHVIGQWVPEGSTPYKLGEEGTRLFISPKADPERYDLRPVMAVPKVRPKRG